MKKLILLELTFLFLATTFSSNPPPGWYQQTLPVSDQINDMFFLDSLNGWVVTYGRINPPDTAYIMRTTNGGDKWNVQYQYANDFLAIQFADENTGYACGGFGIGTLFKTTNGGTNWNNITFGSTVRFADLSFVNKDTGWICSDDLFDGGVFRTNNGGQSWQQQLNLGIGNPLKIFFVNKDTGWFANDFEQLYKTTNGGINWNGQYTFNNNSIFKNLFFVNGDTGWVCESNQNVVQFTSNGGNNWISQTLPSKGGIILTSRPNSISSTDGKIVWGVGGNAFFGMGRVRGIVYKSTNSGYNWYYQLPDTSINIPTYSNIQNVNDSTVWAAYGGIIHTIDGGGLLVKINNINSEIPKNFDLHQNYPNPFNPKTVISYELRVTSYVKLKVYNVQGIEVKTLVNERQNTGEYKTEFDGSGLNSGVYFYVFKVTDEKSNLIISETKSMVLIK